MSVYDCLSGINEIIKNMSPRHEPHPTPHDHQSHEGSQTSLDKERHHEEDKHHPMENVHPHPPHHPQSKPELSPRHNPHTKSPDQALDIDHGTHQDRPRPAKIVKKAGKTGSKVPK